MKQVRVGDLFTLQELERTIHLWKHNSRKDFHDKVLKEIVEPAMPRINAVTGQENNASYMAYLLEYIASTR